MTVVAECVGWQRVRKASAVAECGGVLVAVATRGAAVAECVGDIMKGFMTLKRNKQKGAINETTTKQRTRSKKPISKKQETKNKKPEATIR